jgi:hypothetical protein
MCALLIGKSGEKSLIGKHRCRWEDNIKIDHKEVN